MPRIVKRKLEKASWWLRPSQLVELRELSRRTGVPQSTFMREALSRLLKRYRHITTMKPFTPHEKDIVKYLLAIGREADEGGDGSTSINEILKKVRTPANGATSLEGGSANGGDVSPEGGGVGFDIGAFVKGEVDEDVRAFVNGLVARTYARNRPHTSPRTSSTPNDDGQ
jgi:hypothetical protein